MRSAGERASLAAGVADPGRLDADLEKREGDAAVEAETIDAAVPGRSGRLGELEREMTLP